MRFKKIIIGGTFDLLHAGHKALILEAFRLGEEVFVGVTTDKFNKSRGKLTFENQESRIENLGKFLEERNLNKRVRIALINDIFGNSLKDKEIEAILVTKETIANANLVNKERIKKGFKPLEIIVLEHLKDSSGKIISSSRIRDGEINKYGQSYKELLFKIADISIDQNILLRFKKPFGPIVKNIKKTNVPVVTVGDVTTDFFLRKNISPNLSIIDFKTQRQALSSRTNIVRSGIQNDDFIPGFRLKAGMILIKVNNPQSTISRELILRIEKAIKNNQKNQLIIVEGEEDLAAIPAILLSPLGYKVFYGQPNQGVVEVLVTLEIKEKLLARLGLG